MIKVVVDTNIYILALSFGGVPDEVLDLGRKGKITIFVSPLILKEMEKTLLHKFGWATKQAVEAIATVKVFTQSVYPQEKINLIKEDESDNRVLECAAEAKADAIISGDRHLRKLGTFRGITILKPREFLESKMYEVQP